MCLSVHHLGQSTNEKNESTHQCEPTPCTTKASRAPDRGNRLCEPTPRGTEVARATDQANRLCAPRPSRHAPIESIDPARGWLSSLKWLSIIILVMAEHCDNEEWLSTVAIKKWLITIVKNDWVYFSKMTERKFLRMCDKMVEFVIVKWLTI
jgi:hypothetical protein